MPIPLRSYQSELEPADSQILQILEKQPYQAYTVQELLPKTDDILDRVLQTLALSFRLNKLVEKGLVKSKNIRGILYYVSAKAK